VGDAILAVFDAPVPQADHAFRAALAAAEMQQAIADEMLEEDGPRFRIGINTGVALVGNIGSAEMRSFNVVGDAINVASRLETSAEVGQVVISEETYRSIGDRVEVTALGPIALKGKAEPIVAYRLDGIKAGSPS
jgi:class 3 adenylate cyclase